MKNAVLKPNEFPSAFEDDFLSSLNLRPVCPSSDPSCRTNERSGRGVGEEWERSGSDMIWLHWV
jgi:hypothetical protein